MSCRVMKRLRLEKVERMTLGGRDMLNFVKVSGAVLVLMGMPLSAAAQSATPIMDASALDEVDPPRYGLSDDRLQQCLLGAKIYAKSIDLGYASGTSAKAIRAVEVAPKLEYMYRLRMQTDTLFNIKAAEMKAEYDYFVSADKKTQKALYKVAKQENKSCTKRYQSTKVKNLSRSTEVAKNIMPISSRDAELCYAVGANNSDVSNGFLGLLQKAVDLSVWAKTHELAKRAEGFPESEKVEGLKRDEAKETLKSVGVDRAVSLLEECGAKIEKARFKYNLEKPDDDEVADYVSVLDWD